MSCCLQPFRAAPNRYLRTAPEPLRNRKHEDVFPFGHAPLMRRLSTLWRGHLPLEVAFWTWAVIGGLAVNMLTSALFFVLIMQGQPLAAVVIGYVLSVPYNIVAMVGVWRSAGRYSGPDHWANLARLVTTAGMVMLSVT